MTKTFKLTLISLLTSTLMACGGEKSSSNNSSTNNTKPDTTSNITAKPTKSKLAKFMAEDTVCDVLSKDTIINAFNVTTEIKLRPSFNKYSNSFMCNYDWERSDADERNKKFMTYTMDQMQGKAKKVSMRQRTPQSSITLSLGDYQHKADYFVPRKLTDEELQKQIDAAKKRAAERLTDEQKKLAGDAANSMMKNLLKKNNQNKEITGVGEKAYWSSVGGGALNVLSGQSKVSISLMIGNTEDEDLENAKKIANLIL